jgi:hypothetical protein
MQNYQAYDKPWRYIIVDNFFDEEDQKSLLPLAEKMYDKLLSLPDKKMVLPLEGYEKYRETLQEYLDLLYPDRIADSFKLEMQGMGVHYPSYQKVHTDTSEKHISVVTYLYPEKQHGTLLGKTKFDLENYEKLEWKPNKALVFSQIQGVTWHTVSTFGLSPRVTVNLYLYSSDNPIGESNSACTIEDLE